MKIRFAKRTSAQAKVTIGAILALSAFVLAATNLMYEILNNNNNNNKWQIKMETGSTTLKKATTTTTSSTSSPSWYSVNGWPTNNNNDDDDDDDDDDNAYFNNNSTSFNLYLEYSTETATGYTWIGNQWIPPHNVPTYNPENIRQTFELHNVLFVGDSTARQVFGTLWNIMYKPGPFNETLNETGIVNDDVTLEDINNPEELNVNKYKITENCQRGLHSNTTIEYFFQHDKQMNNGPFVCRQTRSYTKFDLKGAACVNEIQRLELLEKKNQVVEQQQNGTISLPTTSNNLLSDTYDVIIIQNGIWEQVRRSDCKKLDTAEMDLLESLDSSKRLSDAAAASKSNSKKNNRLVIIWVTVGPSAFGNYFGETLNYNSVIRNWFIKHQPSNMYLVDFERPILPRTLGNVRIDGDLKPHWGCEGRTLNSQMLTHAINVIFT